MKTKNKTWDDYDDKCLWGRINSGDDKKYLSTT